MDIEKQIYIVPFFQGLFSDNFRSSRITWTGAQEMDDQKERSKRYGQIVTELLNMGSIDDFQSFFRLLSIWEEAFDLSPKFSEKYAKDFAPYCDIPSYIAGREYPFGIAVEYENSIADVKFAIDQILAGANLYQISSKEWREDRKFREHTTNLDEDEYRELLKRGDTPKKHINTLLLIYNVGCRKELSLGEDGDIIERSPFTEWHFLQNSWDMLTIHSAQALVFCFLEFLRYPGNQALLRKCVRCERYFVASKNDVRIKKCPSCSPLSSMSKERRRAYQREYNRRKRQERIEQEREQRIGNYMRLLGISRDEAVKVVEAGEEM